MKEPNKKDIEMMNRLHRARKTGDLKEIEEVQVYFLSSLKGFIYAKINKMAAGFKENHLEDIKHECYLELLCHLDEFDPTLGTRTTWATPYVVHAIYKYTTREGKRSSLYFGNMATKVNQAISECHKLNIYPSVEILSRMTNLSYSKTEEAIKTLIASKECHFELPAEFDTQFNYDQNEASPEDLSLIHI